MYYKIYMLYSILEGR